MKKIINTDCAPAAIGPYSQGVVKENMIFVSGQLPINPKSGVIETKNAAEQARQSLENVRAVLQQADYELEDVVKTTCFITDMQDFSAINDVYAEFFTNNCPARSCVAVKELPKQALFELEVIACK